MRAVQIAEFGGPEVLEVVDLPKPEAGDGQATVSFRTCPSHAACCAGAGVCNVSRASRRWTD